MTETVIVINPNSSQYITDALSESVEPLRMAGGPRIERVTLKEGPAVIEPTQAAVTVALGAARLGCA